MLPYKNIVFDFGNVIATFDEMHILHQLNASEPDIPLLREIIFSNWAELDDGTVDYGTAMAAAINLAPEHLKELVRSFFINWYKHLPILEDTWSLIHELKEKGASLYILSNAPTYFAEHADYYDIVKEFDGVVFSAPLVLSKPDAKFYQYLFDTYHLNPSECFFIDDKAVNIEAGKKLGMDGIVFTGDISSVRKVLGLDEA